jgi:hypothetical protein
LVTDWQSPSVPRSISVPWEVFREEIEAQLDEALNRQEEMRADSLRRELYLLRGRGAKEVFLGLSAPDQLAYTEVSIQELAAYVSWRRAARRQTPDEPAAALEAAWEKLAPHQKATWTPRAPCSVLLADGQFFPLVVKGVSLIGQAAPNEEDVVKTELVGPTKKVVVKSELSALANKAATNTSDSMVKSELAGPTQKVVVKSERSALAHQAATNASDTMVKSELTGPIEKVVVKSELPAPRSG